MKKTVNISEFLIKYGSLLLEHHKTDILQFLIKYGSEPPVHKNGHYLGCAWACDNPTDGPDTCYCCYRKLEEAKIKRIIKLYYRILKMYEE